MATTISPWNFAHLAANPFGAPNSTNISDVGFLFDNLVENSKPSGWRPDGSGSCCRRIATCVAVLPQEYLQPLGWKVKCGKKSADAVTNHVGR